MPRRAALITQADVARAIRAMRAAGLPVVRIVVRPDGVALETEGAAPAGPDPAPALDADKDRVVIL